MSSANPSPSRRLPSLAGRGASRTSNRGGNTLEQVAPNRRQIAVTSFDLLNGAYQVSARNRRISVILAAVVLIGVAWQGGQAVQNRLELTEITSSVLELKERQRAATTRFSASTGLPEGITEQQLLTRYDRLTVDLKQVSVSSATPFEVLASINDPSITVSRVTTRLLSSSVLDSSKEGEESSSSNSATEDIADPALIKGLEALKAGEVLLETTVTATAVDIAALTRWAQRVRDANIFANIVVERVGAVYTLTGVQVQSRTPNTVFTPWSQAGLPISLGTVAAPSEATP